MNSEAGLLANERQTAKTSAFRFFSSDVKNQCWARRVRGAFYPPKISQRHLPPKQNELCTLSVFPRILSVFPPPRRRNRYTWVMRSRLDIAWMLPIPPISRFPTNRVTAGHNFFPLADQFLLMPRCFAATVFGTVSLCYACDTLKAQAESGIPAQTENFLRLVLRRDGVPFGFFEFPVVIVRNHEGGVCGVLHPYKLTCQMLHAGGLIDSATRCADVVNRWHRGACLEMFPPLPLGGDTSAQENVGAARGSSHGVPGPATGGHGNDGERNDVERLDESEAFVSNMVVSDAHDEGKDSREENFGRRADEISAIRRKHGDDRGVKLASGNSVVSFDEATDRLDGMRRDLREMGEAIRVHVSPRENSFDFFGAHHYPFQKVDGGPLDFIATIAGFRLSEADFNAIALAFACLLSDAGLGDGTAEEAEGGAKDPIRRAGEKTPGEEAAPGGSRSGGTKPSGRLVLKTTAEAGDVHAIVNCTLVNPLHVVSIALLDKEFEPSEVVCRGRVEPCLSRAQAEAAKKRHT